MHNFANYQKTKYEITLRDFEECIKVAEIQRSLNQKELATPEDLPLAPPLKELEPEIGQSGKKSHTIKIHR